MQKTSGSSVSRSCIAGGGQDPGWSWRIMSVNLYYNAINISQPWTPLFISGRGSLELGNRNDDMKRGGHKEEKFLQRFFFANSQICFFLGVNIQGVDHAEERCP